ncbi:MAG TPA: hypothetical protein VFH47_06880 [Candidatus Thermoplasmatota archaeon]|nr:hypothetical protein [Candidatus Thermoplasmatota archaeon]
MRPRPRVLLVAKDPAIASLVRDALEVADAGVAWCADGAVPDVIVLAGGGHSVAEAVATQRPVLVCAEGVTAAQQRAWLEAGVAEVVAVESCSPRALAQALQSAAFRRVAASPRPAARRCGQRRPRPPRPPSARQ